MGAILVTGCLDDGLAGWWGVDVAGPCGYSGACYAQNTSALLGETINYWWGWEKRWLVAGYPGVTPGGGTSEWWGGKTAWSVRRKQANVQSVAPGGGTDGVVETVGSVRVRQYNVQIRPPAEVELGRPQLSSVRRRIRREYWSRSA